MLNADKDWTHSDSQSSKMTNDTVTHSLPDWILVQLYKLHSNMVTPISNISGSSLYIVWLDIASIFTNIVDILSSFFPFYSMNLNTLREMSAVLCRPCLAFTRHWYMIKNLLWHQFLEGISEVPRNALAMILYLHDGCQLSTDVTVLFR